MRKTTAQLYRFTPCPGVDFIDPKDGKPAKAHTCYILATKEKDGSIKTHNLTENAHGQFKTVEEWGDFMNRVQLSYIVEGLNVLHLVLTRQWYDMIDSGEKKEEYRGKTSYWCKRLCTAKDKPNAVTFHRAYTSTTQTYLIEDITSGRGRLEWGASGKETFIIKLGERIQ